jgi:hypothetical protein
LPWSS